MADDLFAWLAAWAACERADRAEERIRELEAELAKSKRCLCPVGFGAVRDPSCPRHGNRQPAHTITGPVSAPADLPSSAFGSCR